MVGFNRVLKVVLDAAEKPRETTVDQDGFACFAAVKRPGAIVTATRERERARERERKVRGALVHVYVQSKLRAE